MAERRMFSKSIIDSDLFLDMSLTAQSLYFHFCMRADDEGFINNPKRILKLVGASKKDFDSLVKSNLLITFESGICVIKHWKVHNYVRADRLTKTAYQAEFEQLVVLKNGEYALKSCQPNDNQMSVTCPSNDNQVTANCQPNDNQMTTTCQHRLGKDSIGKDSIDKDSTVEGSTGECSVLFTDPEELYRADNDQHTQNTTHTLNYSKPIPIRREGYS